MPADVVFRVGRACEMTAERGIHQAVAVEDGRITAVGRARDELDSLIGPGTAVIAAGSDCNVSFFDPLLSIWGLVTRGTRTVGVQGPEYQVDTYTAIRLYTEAAGRLLREDGDVGVLAPGAFADIVGFRADLLDCPVDDLPSQQPALTLVSGRPVHDPDGLLGAA